MIDVGDDSYVPNQLIRPFSVLSLSMGGQFDSTGAIPAASSAWSVVPYSVKDWLRRACGIYQTGGCYTIVPAGFARAFGDARTGSGREVAFRVARA